jgi:hypothetical protein
MDANGMGPSAIVKALKISRTCLSRASRMMTRRRHGGARRLQERNYHAPCLARWRPLWPIRHRPRLRSPARRTANGSAILSNPQSGLLFGPRDNRRNSPTRECYLDLDQPAAGWRERTPSARGR